MGREETELIELKISDFVDDEITTQRRRYAGDYIR